MSRSQNGQLDLFSSPQPAPDQGPQAIHGRLDEAVAPVIAASAGLKRKARTRLPETASLAPVEPDRPYLSDTDVATRYSVSRPTVWRWTKSLKGFPQPVRISSGTTRWRLTDLQAYDRMRSAQNDGPRGRKGKGAAS